MITEAIPTSAASENAEESKKTLALVHVKAEEAKTETMDMMPKLPCGGIMVGD